MTWAASPGPRGRGSRFWWALAVVLLIVGAGCLAAGLRGQEQPLAGPVLQLAPPSATDGAAPDSVTPPAPSLVERPLLARSTPVSLRIPAIGVAAPLGTLGLNPDQTVEVPTDYQEPGWYRLGPSPGQMGSAVILGHVDSYQGPAIFAQLHSLRPGDRVEVSLADGGVARFAVTTVETYPKEQFPALRVYGSHGYSGLQLVTCGGEFDTRTGSYKSNVVAYTTLIATTPAAPAAVRAGRS